MAYLRYCRLYVDFFFFFNDTATTEIYTLSLHDALPISSNIGGTATLIGDPPNIIIAGATGLSFNDFIVNLAPVVLFTFAVVIPGLYLVYRRRLQIDDAKDRKSTRLNSSHANISYAVFCLKKNIFCTSG